MKINNVTSGIRPQNFDEKLDQDGRKCASQNGRHGRSLKSKKRQKTLKNPCKCRQKKKPRDKDNAVPVLCHLFRKMSDVPEISRRPIYGSRPEHQNHHEDVRRTLRN